MSFILRDAFIRGDSLTFRNKWAGRLDEKKAFGIFISVWFCSGIIDRSHLDEPTIIERLKLFQESILNRDNELNYDGKSSKPVWWIKNKIRSVAQSPPVFRDLIILTKRNERDMIEFGKHQTSFSCYPGIKTMLKWVVLLRLDIRDVRSQMKRCYRVMTRASKGCQEMLKLTVFLFWQCNPTPICTRMYWRDAVDHKQAFDCNTIHEADIRYLCVTHV